MLCVPAFMKLCFSRNPTSGRNNDGMNGKLEGLSPISNTPPIENGWSTDPIITKIITPRCVMIMFAIIKFMVALKNFPIYPLLRGLRP